MRAFGLLVALLISMPSRSVEPSAPLPDTLRMPKQEVPPAAGPLKVLSFNIRAAQLDNGERGWPVRRAGVVAVIRAQAPDVLGLQEAMHVQIRDLLADLPEYAATGVGRVDGRAEGEFSLLLFRRERFVVAEAGTFWLSDTPAIPGSSTWGNRNARSAGWARLIDRDGSALWAYSVHLDRGSKRAREEGVRLLAERIALRSDRSEPFVVAGDFNTGPESAAVNTLTLPRPGPAMAEALELRAEPTYNAFGKAKKGSRLDYVFVSPDAQVSDAAVVQTEGFPSDHWPVVATIRFRTGDR